MIYARRLLSFVGFGLIGLYSILFVMSLKNKTDFDYFSFAFLLFGFYLLLKSIIYLSDSSFFLGGIFYLFSLLFHFFMFGQIWFYCIAIVVVMSFLTFAIFDSNMMKIVFLGSMTILFLSLPVFFLL